MMTTPMFPAPGTPVFVRIGLFRHLGVVSDQWRDGKPMVISHSFRAGGTYEEHWDVFAAGRTVYLEDLRSELPAWEVLARARSWIGRKRWSIWENCEHHLRFALGHRAGSPQLGTAVTVAIIAGLFLR